MPGVFAARVGAAADVGSISRRQRGFSLLELLVALMVIVLITSLVTLTVNSGGQDIRLEAAVRQLADVAAFALDEAQMTGQDYGLLLEEEFVDGTALYSYRWLQRELDGWQAPRKELEVFDSKQLPPDVTVELQLEDSPLADLGVQASGEADEDEPLRPQIVLYSSGETTAGTLDFRQRGSGELLWRLEWDLLGRFELLRRGVPEEAVE